MKKTFKKWYDKIYYEGATHFTDDNLERAWNAGCEANKGLKDHEIQELVNSVRDTLNVSLMNSSLQPMRQIILGATMKYLEENNLRIDKR